MSSDRSAYVTNARRIVIKLGTQLLSSPGGGVDPQFVASIASEVAALRQRDIQVTLVSSGAIGCGVRELKLPKRPTDLGALQAVAAVGQRRLMDAWAAAFEPHRLPVAQLLLTRGDIDDRTRYLNLRNTVASVHALGAIPIINENDTVSTAELVRLTFGDNDILAALVAHALLADLLILLSVVDGILDSEGKPVRLVDNVRSVEQLVRDEKSAAGKGGMDSKLQAARMLTDAGEAMIVADGRVPKILDRLLSGEALGTLFVSSAPGRKRPSRRRWIGSVQPTGRVVVDEGACRALIEQHRSLLPAGIRSVEGSFVRGDVIGICALDGRLIGRGLSNYSSDEMSSIAGMRSSAIRKLLADGAYDEAIHKDNLVLEP